MAAMKSVRKVTRSNGFANILAIGTANPPNAVEQSIFADFYFRVTNTNHLVDLKNKFQRICEKTAIRKRHFVWDEELLKKNQCLRTAMAPSLAVRQKIAAVEVPKLGMEAALRAIDEWGQPKSRITHLIFCTTSGANLPSADVILIRLLGLNPSVKRVMLHQQGCFAGGTVLRIAKDLAENHKGARVLIVCAETTVVVVRPPSLKRQDDLIIQALFADGASALVVGADPEDSGIEKPIFSIISATQVLLPNSEGAIRSGLVERGVIATIHKDLPILVSRSIEKCLQEALNFSPLDVFDWNSIFWVAHPGGRAILDQLEERLRLRPEKLMASRHVLAEYGNMAGVSVHFILDEVRKRSVKEGKMSTGEGFEWGVLLGLGPGITVETVLLRSATLV
ncbi:hypothetical protein M5K25_019705 [Dendrobium thyrsiflorum]|uniref:Chalcone synthase n=1 Tax=Dendrobium thyrsiflorum TaxID=117978 RepID=A0ABD0UMC5_DENTH